MSPNRDIHPSIEVGGVTFDATVPSTQASADAAATGTAGTAARRDHKHGMPTLLTAATVAGGAVVAAPVSVGASSTAELDGPVVNVPTIGGVLHFMGTARIDGNTSLTLRFYDAGPGLITAYGYAVRINMAGANIARFTINGTSIAITVQTADANQTAFFHAFLKPAGTGNHKMTAQFSNSDADHDCTASAYWTS